MFKKCLMVACPLLLMGSLPTLVHAAGLVSKNATGADSSNGASLDHVVSANGVVVAFRSSGNNFSPTDTNGKDDIYARDYSDPTGTVELISVDNSGKPGRLNCSPPLAISADGSRIAFTSGSKLDAGDVNNAGDVYVRDRHAHTTILISKNVGTQKSGNSGSFEPVISPDGQLVVFRSSASSLGPLDTNGLADIYALNLANNSMTLVSRNYNRQSGANAMADEAKISGDGRYVVFSSPATDHFAPGDLLVKGFGDIYRMDLLSPTQDLTLVSINGLGTGGGNISTSGQGRSDNPYINSDGRYIAFTSTATDLLDSQTFSSGYHRVYVRDTVLQKTLLVSAAANGGDGDGESTALGISADGRYVLFESTATNLVDPPTVGTNIFVRDVPGHITTLVSVHEDGTSGDGTNGLMSANGRFVVFRSASGDLGPTDTNDLYDVYKRDLLTGEVTLISVNGTGSSGGNMESVAPAMSQAGDVVVFRSHGNDFGPTDTNAKVDIYRYPQ